MGLARGGGPHRGGGRGSGRGIQKKGRGGGPMVRPGPPPLMGPPGPLGGPRMRPPPPGMMPQHHGMHGVRPPPPGMRHPRPPMGMVRPPPPGFRPPPGPHGPHGPHGPMGMHGPRMGPPGMPPRPPPPGMMRGRGGMMRPPMMPPRFGPPGPHGPPGPLGIPPLGPPMGPPMGPPFMMRLPRTRGRGGLGGKGGKNKKKPKSGTNRPTAELEKVELARPWVNDTIRPEILKKHALHAEARTSKDMKDWEAFKAQKKKVAAMMYEAKMEYIGSHPEEVSDEADTSSGDEVLNDEEDEEDLEAHDDHIENDNSQEWDWTQDSDSPDGLGGTDTQESHLVTSHHPNTVSSAESYQSHEYDNYGYQSTTMPYPSDDSSQYESQDYQNYYGWQETGTQLNTGQDFTQDQWFQQWCEQLYAAYQQYAVPYQYSSEYASHSSEYASPSYASYSSNNSPSGLQKDQNQKQPSRRKPFDKPLSLFYCESCDRSFADNMKLQEHLSEHRVCGIDGCKFTAHTKVVDKHIQMQHDTGLYRRMKSNDDTEKWRAERKKKYPSRANVEARQLQQQEMINRGERMGFDRNKFNNSRGRGGRGRGRARGGGITHDTRSPMHPNVKQEKQEDHPPSQWRPQFPVPVVEDIDTCVRGKLSKFPGTGYFKSDKEKVDEVMAASNALHTLCDYGTESSDEETNVHYSETCSAIQKECEKQSSQNTDNIIVMECNADKSPPSCLLDSTVSKDCGSESDGSAPDEVPIVKESANHNDIESNTKSTNLNESRKRRRHHSSQGTTQNCDKNDKAQIAAKSLETSHHESAKKQKPSFSSRGRGRGPYHDRIRPPTLLEKLLAPDIQNERNVILQCVHYVVEKKFFNVGHSALDNAPAAN